MKKLLLSLFLFSFVVLPAYAKEDDVKMMRPAVQNRQVKREEIKSNIQTKRAEFKEKRALIRDKTKQAVVDRIDAQLNKFNEQFTGMMQRAVDRMQELSGKLSSRLDALNAEGKDVTAAKAALTEADTALTTAETAVIAQAEKDYVIEITEESQLREAAQAAKAALRADLKVVHDLVKAAREQLREALALAKEVK